MFQYTPAGQVCRTVDGNGNSVQYHYNSLGKVLDKKQPSSHVEGKAAIYMRENDITQGTVYHNNTDGTCPYCNSMLPTLLEDGSSLTAIPPSNASAPKPGWIDIIKTYIGNDNAPKSLNKNKRKDISLKR